MDEEIEILNNQSSEELYERQVIKTDKGQEPYRIDKFLMNRVEGATRNKIQQAIEAGMVTVDGHTVKSNFKVKGNQEIIVFTTNHPDTSEVVPEQMDIQNLLMYEDDALMVINKPAGMVVHPGSGNYSGTLLNGVSWYLKQQIPPLDESILPRFGLRMYCCCF